MLRGGKIVVIVLFAAQVPCEVILEISQASLILQESTDLPSLARFRGVFDASLEISYSSKHLGFLDYSRLLEDPLFAVAPFFQPGHGATDILLVRDFSLE